MNWRIPTPREVLLAAFLLIGLWGNYKVWTWALEPPVIRRSEEPIQDGPQVWKVHGDERSCHHISTSRPDFDGSYTVTGHAKDGSILWSYAKTTKIERLK